MHKQRGGPKRACDAKKLGWRINRAGAQAKVCDTPWAGALQGRAKRHCRRPSKNMGRVSLPCTANPTPDAKEGGAGETREESGGDGRGRMAAKGLLVGGAGPRPFLLLRVVIVQGDGRVDAVAAADGGLPTVAPVLVAVLLLLVLAYTGVPPPVASQRGRRRCGNAPDDSPFRGATSPSHRGTVPKGHRTCAKRSPV